MKDTGITIPEGDHNRANIFGDPYPGIEKHIKIVDEFGIEHMFSQNKKITIPFNSISKHLMTLNNPKLWYDKIGKFISNPIERLNELHKLLELSGGSFSDEYPEQLLTIQYINEDSRVLEIGGNIGRNSLIISSILKDARNLVILESDPEIAKQLSNNLKMNDFQAHIEASAISQVPLIQKGWDTFPLYDNQIPEGWKKISTISFNDLLRKYGIDFDTLIADCEGALYYILKDDPDILNNINLIIIENDFRDLSQKEFVDQIFRLKGFQRVLAQSGGWAPCYDFFYEVWKKV